MAGFWAVLPALFWRVAPKFRHALVACACIAFCAATLERLGTFSSALRLWDDVAQKNAGVPALLVERGYLNRGMARFDLGQRDAAFADFERAIALNQRYPDAWIGRASVYLNSAQPALALADLDRALSLDEHYASAWDKRCVALSELGRMQEARSACERAIFLDPRNADALVNTGALYRKLGLTEAAADRYREALAVNPAHGAANSNLGVLLLDAGRRDEIVRDYIVKGCDAGIAISCDILKRSRRGASP
jgi:tetratricopeptide (TPR) repeat protein